MIEDPMSMDEAARVRITCSAAMLIAKTVEYEREQILEGIRALMPVDPSLLGRLLTPTINYVLGEAINVVQSGGSRG